MGRSNAKRCKAGVQIDQLPWLVRRKMIKLLTDDPSDALALSVNQLRAVLARRSGSTPVSWHTMDDHRRQRCICFAASK